jgi:hypothetical protein
VAIEITIQNKVIEFPESGASPNWAPAVVAFAQAVEAALASVVGSFDVAPQTQNIDASNPGTDVDITSLNFPPATVRSASVFYAVSRETDSASAVEGGTFTIVYNADNPVTEKWELAQYKAITDTGQIRYSTTALAGSNHVGDIAFRAVAVLNNV